MSEITIRGVDISFPFKPYKVQEDYMHKVIECLQGGKHGVLESPTGTGKTLSLLCSSLGWLSVKKAQFQAQEANNEPKGKLVHEIYDKLDKAVGETFGTSSTFAKSLPQIIYASRTHSQLSQAISELKRTSYRNVAVAVLGSRDQLCIHPQVMKEQNSSNKIHMCQAKVQARTCHYYNNVEQRKEDPVFRETIMDIEDLVKFGNKLQCCPYFLSRELKQKANIVFMPYNYILDPKTRKYQGIDLENNVILLDEAHNVEKTCEEAASLQISSTDIAVCIDEISMVMNDMAVLENPEDFKDFTKDDLCLLKPMFLEFEKAIDSIELIKKEEGRTFPGGFIFELLAKAEITQGREQFVLDRLDKIIAYLTTVSTSAFNKKGNGLQKFCDFLRVVFIKGSAGLKYKDKIKECYKVYVQIEEPKKSFKNDVWETKKMTKSDGKVISYWCFSPSFSMQQLVDQKIHSVILTSGTLSPLKPYISELGIPISIELENPHIVTSDQICVGVLSQGPDGHSLNSSYNTRNDPKYISSLGQTIFNFSCLLPDGLLIFFPSYPIMKKCREDWQNSGIWTKIAERKPIYVEPQTKESFLNVMNEYYQKIQDPNNRGAIFMAVCRGKVSEGLDFANANGRAVLITGLPYPPLKDPRVMLKQRYLDENKFSGKESLTGQQWYQLEASRAVNQAIGRIIRHKNDYGAIILCDCRFDNNSFKQQLSAWLRPYIKKFDNFGVVTRTLREFFKNAHENLPQPASNKSSMGNSVFNLPPAHPSFESGSRKIMNNSSKRNVNKIDKTDDFDLNSYLKDCDNNKSKDQDKNLKSNDFSLLFNRKEKNVVNFSNCKLDSSSNILVPKTSCTVKEPLLKKRKIKIQPVKFSEDNEVASCSFKEESSKADSSVTDKKELGKNYLKEVKKSLSTEEYKIFQNMTVSYTKNGNFDELYINLENLFVTGNQLKHLFLGFKSFLKKNHNSLFEKRVEELEALNVWLS